MSSTNEIKAWIYLLPGVDEALLRGPTADPGPPADQGQDLRVLGVQLGQGAALLVARPAGGLAPRAGGGKLTLKENFSRLAPVRGGAGGRSSHQNTVFHLRHNSVKL